MRSDSSTAKKKLISQLNNKLVECMKNNEPVSLHLHTGKEKVTVRITIIPEEVNINENEFYIEYKSFHFMVNHGLDYIEYVDKYDYDSFYVEIDDTRMFFDFI